MANLVLNGKSIDCIDEIAENFVEDEVVAAYRSGCLVAWLEEYGYDDEASRVKAITNKGSLVKNIVKALDLDPAVVKSSQKRLAEIAAKKLEEKAAEEKRFAELAAQKAEEEKRLEELAAQKAQEESSISGNNSAVDALFGVGQTTEESVQSVASIYGEHWIDPEKCVACGCCIDVCPSEAIYPVEPNYAGSTYAINSSKCVNCGACAADCPAEAIQCGACQNAMTEEPPVQINDAALWSRLVNLVVEQLGVNYEEVTPNSRFIDDLGCDSLDVVELTMAFEEEFCGAVPEEDVERLTTPGKVFQYLKSKGY